MTELSEQQALASVIDRLGKKFPDRSRADIESVVVQEYGALSQGPIRDFVPVLVERAAKEKLKA